MRELLKEYPYNITSHAVWGKEQVLYLGRELN